MYVQIKLIKNRDFLETVLKVEEEAIETKGIKGLILQKDSHLYKSA